MARELPDTTDQGRGVVQLEHRVVSENGVISNVDPSERHDRRIFGLNHEITVVVEGSTRSAFIGTAIFAGACVSPPPSVLMRPR